MTQVNGFFGHIQQKHTRSIIMFGGFALSMQLACAALLSVPMTVLGQGAWPVVFDDPKAYFIAFGPFILGLSAILFVASYHFHDALTKWTTGFENVQGIAQPRLEFLVRNLAITAGIPEPKLGMIRTPALNAFACGRSADTATIVVTEGLLRELSDQELQAVIAHEITHIANGDIEMMAAANASMSVIKIMNMMNPVRWWRGGIPKFMYFLPMLLLPLLMIVMMVGIVVKISSTLAGVSRYFITSSREFIADAEAVRLTHNPAALISALQKIEGRSHIPHLDSMTDSMMIDGVADGEFASHPPISERIAALVQYGGSMIHGAATQTYSGGGFGQRRPAHLFGQTPMQAKTVYREKTKKNIFERINAGSSHSITGLPKPAVTGAFVLTMIFLAIGIQGKIDAPDRDAQRARVAASYTAPEIKMSPAFVVLNLSGRGLMTRRLSQSETFFDMHGTGEKNRTGWIDSGSGFLFFDANGNHYPDGMAELIALPQDRAASVKFLYPLQKLDSNANGRVDRNDRDFRKLKIWRDYGGDGVHEPGETQTLREVDVKAISVKFAPASEWEGRTVASKTRLMRKGSYSSLSGGESALYLTSFQTDLARYIDTSAQYTEVRPSSRKETDRLPWPDLSGPVSSTQRTPGKDGSIKIVYSDALNAPEAPPAGRSIHNGRLVPTFNAISSDISPQPRQNPRRVSDNPGGASVVLYNQDGGKQTAAQPPLRGAKARP